MNISDVDIARKYVNLNRKCVSDNIAFNLTLRDFKRLFRREYCPYIGVRLVHKEISTGQVVPNNYPTIDKIIPSKGYIKGNVVVASYKGNIMKGNIDEATANNILKIFKRVR